MLRLLLLCSFLACKIHADNTVSATPLYPTATAQPKAEQTAPKKIITPSNLEATKVAQTSDQVKSSKPPAISI